MIGKRCIIFNVYTLKSRLLESTSLVLVGQYSDCKTGGGRKECCINIQINAVCAKSGL